MSANICEVCGAPARVRMIDAETHATFGYCEAHQPNELEICKSILAKSGSLPNKLNELTARTKRAIDASRRERLERIIAELEHFRRRTATYVTQFDAPNTQSFLAGFRYALRVLGEAEDQGPHADATAAHGYINEPAGLIPQMKRRGMNEQAIMDELVAMEIDAFRVRLAHLRDKS